MKVYVRSKAVDAADAAVPIGARKIAERYGFIFSKTIALLFFDECIPYSHLFDFFILLLLSETSS